MWTDTLPIVPPVEWNYAMSKPRFRPSRRRFVKSAAIGVAALVVPGTLGRASAQEDQPLPVRQITRGPKYHWFGYYDKWEFDPGSRYVLGMEVDFEHRSPQPDDQIALGMIDLHQGDQWIELGHSRAWCWQQGCMLQWLPGSKTEVLWNDRDGDRFVCRIMDTASRQVRTIGHPIYSVGPDGRWAISTDFRRVNDTRPGYGYCGLPDPYADQPAPSESGIWRVDLTTGQQQLIVALADVAKIPFEYGEMGQGKHWFNHLLVNPDGSRIEFLHRWKTSTGSWLTRMFTARPDGSDLRVLNGSGSVSHFIWRDPEHILAYSKPKPDMPWGFFLYEDKPGGKVEPIGKDVMGPGDGHCSYLPGNDWIVCDTYPDRQRFQHVYLYQVSTNRRVPLGKFYLPPEYRGQWRCDTHPRFSPDGRTVVIDSPHTGQGRQLHLIDIGPIVGA